MPLRLFLECPTPPPIMLPRVLRGCFVEDIPVKRMAWVRFPEGELNFVFVFVFLWVFLFYAFHDHKYYK